jgi:hypothetical protein
MPKRGRPTIPRSRIRSERILLKLTPSERRRLGELSRQRGVTMADYLRYSAGIADAAPMGNQTPPLDATTGQR